MTYTVDHGLTMEGVDRLVRNIDLLLAMPGMGKTYAVKAGRSLFSKAGKELRSPFVDMDMKGFSHDNVDQEASDALSYLMKALICQQVIPFTFTTYVKPDAVRGLHILMVLPLDKEVWLERLKAREDLDEFVQEAEASDWKSDWLSAASVYRQAGARVFVVETNETVLDVLESLQSDASIFSHFQGGQS